MNRISSKAKIVVALVLSLTLVATATPQLRQIIKLVGVGAAVKEFGPDINKALNRLTKHEDNARVMTKVVPIVSAGIAGRQSIGAAQVMGPPAAVKQVQAVAAIDQDLFGKEIKIRAMIPIDSMDPTNLRGVEGVGVSGTVDLKL